MQTRLVLLLWLGAGLAPVSVGRADEPVTLQLKWRHQFQFAGYYAAQAKGFYAEEGIEVNILEGRAGRPAIATVLAGEAVFGVSDSAVVLARMQGKPLVACAAIFQHSPYIVMSRRDRGLRRPADLVGAKVMLADDQGVVQLRAMLAREGLPPEGCTLVPHTWKLDDLIEGRVDAISAYATVEPALMRARGVEPAMMRTIDYGVDFYGDLLFTTEPQAREQPERTNAFVRASLRGWDYALRNPGELADLILKLPGVAERGATRESLLAEAAAMRAFIMPDVVEIGHMNPGRWRHIAETFAEFGGVKLNDVALAGFVHDPERVEASLFSRRVMWIGGGVALLFGLGLLWTVQMRRQVGRRTRELREEVRHRAEAELELRRSEERFRTMFTGASTGIATTTMAGKFLQANPAYCATTGHAEEELRGMNVIELIHPEDRPAFDALFRRLGEAGEGHFVTETRCLKKSGGWLWKRASVSMVRGEGGAPPSVIAVTEDITERIETAERLRQSEDRFRHAARATADAIWDWDPVTGTFWWSEGMAALLGHAGDAPSPGFEAWTSHIHPDDRERVAAGFRAFLKGGEETWRANYRFLRKDGAHAFVLDRAFAIRDADGRVARAVGGLTDITGLRRAEEAASANAELLRLASRIGGIGAWELAFPGPRLSWSDEVYRIHELDAGSPLELGSALDYYPGESRRLLEAAVAKGEPYDLELEFVTAKGNRRWVRTTSAAEWRDGELRRLYGVIQDVTDRRLAAEGLRASEAQYRLLFHHNPHPMWVYETGTLRFLAVNAAAVAHYGYSEAEFLAMTIQDIRPERQLEALHRAVAAIVPGEKMFGAWTHRKKDGTEIEVEVSSDGIVFDGRPARLTLAHDVTERRVAERERRKTQEAVFAVARGVSAAAGADFFDRLTLSMVEALGADAGMVAMFEPPDRERARTISLVVDGVVRPNLDYPLAGAPCEWMAQGEVRVFARDVRRLFPESRLMAELETEAWVGYPLAEADGELEGVMVVSFRRALGHTAFIASTLRIFAARATAELERRRVDERVREQAALLDKAQDAILVRDLDHRITYWNKSAERLYGWTAAEAIGNSVEKLLYRDTTAFHEAMRQLTARGEWVGELAQFDKNGVPLIIEGRWTLVRDDRGVPRGVLAINTDITEKKKLELQFLRAQRMESIGTLAGGIAHDLNNVLAPIIMAIDLLQLSITDSRSLSMLATMASSARRGADMVSQVLSFARGVEGQRIEVQPAQLIRDIEKIALDTFPKNIRIETRLGPDLWAVSGDPTQLHQVLINLCVNARDAMPEGGRLVIGAQNQLLDAHYAAMNIEAKAGPHVVMQIEDTGTGIPPAILEKIFDPFFTTKAQGKGTGLGLSTSLAIVKSHEGFLRVYSEPERGTRFQIYLPARPAGVVSEVVAAPAHLPRGNGELVLVVDDEAAIRQVTKQTLEAFGYRTLVAADGAEATALYAARRDEIAVVLTDMMMPVMDGPATIHALLKINPTVRIIAASGITANGKVAKAAGVGVRHFLPKPYTAETLLKVLRQILQDRQPAQAPSD